jgi:hypothetical protein
MANLRQAKTDDEIKKLTVNNVKGAYHDLAIDYNHLLDLDYIYCPHCGKWKSTKGNGNFYKSSKSKSGFEHFACKACILDLCTDVNTKTGIRTDNREKTINTFRQLDWKFCESDYNAQLQIINEGIGEKVRGTAVQNLIVMIASLPQYNNTSYKDSEFSIDDIENNPEEDIKIVQKTLRSAKKRFGNSYSNEDLMFLENEYQDWITRYECNTKAQETIFERLAFKKWEINKATKAGQNTKDLDKTYTDLLASINILPRQNADSGLDSSLTFGQLIEQWESTKPIPEPDPEFADVNHIAKYIKTWFKGSLARSLGIDNGYSKEYDDELQKYSVKKQDYSEDDESDDIYKTVFGDSSK